MSVMVGDFMSSGYLNRKRTLAMKGAKVSVTFSPYFEVDELVLSESQSSDI